MAPQTPRRIVYQFLDELVPAPTNPKAHDLDALAASITEFGYVEAAVVDERTGRLVAGHGRTETLSLAHAAGLPAPDGVLVDRGGRWRVPVQRGWSSRDDAQARAYVITSNRTPELGGWNDEALLVEVDALESELLAAAGFDDAAIAALRARSEDAETVRVREHDRAVSDRNAEADAAEEPIRVPEDPVTRPGDVWQIGPHRLVCGDCRDAETVQRLLDGAVVNLAFTSPPYADRRKYDESSGFVPVHPDGYVEWFAPVAAIVAEHLADDGSWFVNIRAGSDGGLDKEAYVLDLVLAHAREWGWHWSEEYCWERNGMPGQVTLRLRNQWESVHQFTRSRWKFRPDAVRVPSGNTIIPLGPGTGASTWAVAQGTAVDGRTRFSEDRRAEGLAYPGNRLPTFAGSHEATGHTAAFPIGLPEWFLRAYTDEGDVLLDPFVGSGSSLLAAHRQGRVGFGVELSPGYCDVVVERFRRRLGVDAVRIPAGG